MTNLDKCTLLNNFYTNNSSFSHLFPFLKKELLHSVLGLTSVMNHFCVRPAKTNKSDLKMTLPWFFLHTSFSNIVLV